MPVAATPVVVTLVAVTVLPLVVALLPLVVTPVVAILVVALHGRVHWMELPPRVLGVVMVISSLTPVRVELISYHK